MKKIFPNLNALRFIAASLVIIFHIEGYKKIYNLPNLMFLEFFNIVGRLGVNLFFVLSGFLITSLLLKEKDCQGKINFKAFYQRRILRIWPLYFLILLIGFFILPNFDYWKIPSDIFPPIENYFWTKLFLYIIILPNLAVVIFREIVGVSQVWSLGTEEQFYLVWPFIIERFRKNLLFVMLSILVLYWVILIGSGRLVRFFPDSTFWKYLNGYLYVFNINSMAIGGLFALLYHDNHYAILKIIFNRFLFFFVCALTLVCLFCGIKFGFIHNDIYSILFAIIILNLACNDRYAKTLENRAINYLGSISYGLYMYHPMVLPIAILFGKKYQSNLLIYLITIGTTILVAAVSFEFFEKYFLKMKSRIANDNSSYTDLVVKDLAK